MHDDASPSPEAPRDGSPATDIDPAELRAALDRTGRMLKTAGLPFEAEEFDEDASSAVADERAGAAAAGAGDGDDAEPADHPS